MIGAIKPFWRKTPCLGVILHQENFPWTILRTMIGIFLRCPWELCCYLHMSLDPLDFSHCFVLDVIDLAWVNQELQCLTWRFPMRGMLFMLLEMLAARFPIEWWIIDCSWVTCELTSLSLWSFFQPFRWRYDLPLDTLWILPQHSCVAETLHPKTITSLTHTLLQVDYLRRRVEPSGSRHRRQTWWMHAQTTLCCSLPWLWW